jgi:hypothetical protein
LNETEAVARTKTVMKKRELRPSEIVELLTPLIDMMDQCSVSSLKSDPEGLTKKVKMSGAPIRLTHNGNVIAIMCDPSVFMQVEKRRRKLVALLEDAPRKFVPTLGRRAPFAHPSLQELKRCVEKKEGLEGQINSQKCCLYDLEEALQTTTEHERTLMAAIKPVRLPSG